MEGLKVFISWSKEGTSSHRVAQLVNESINSRFEGKITSWISDSISPGARGINEINRELKDADVGIICLTSESIGAPWVSYESGAISINKDEGRVIPLFIDISPEAHAKHPLAQFNYIIFDKDGFSKLFTQLNAMTDKPVSARNIKDIIRGEWEDHYEEIYGALVTKPQEADRKISTSRFPINETMGKAGKNFFISGSTMVFLSNTNIFAEKMEHGASGRFLLLSQNKETVKQAADFFNVDAEILHAQLVSSMVTLQKYGQKGYSFEVRTMSFIPSAAFIGYDLGDSESVITAQHYLFKTPNDRILYIMVRRADELYDIYQKQIETMWTHSDPYELSKPPF